MTSTHDTARPPEPTQWQLLTRLVLGEEEPARPQDSGPRGSVDRVLLLVVLGLTLFGLVMVFSASAIDAVESTGSPYYFLERQVLAAVLAPSRLFRTGEPLAHLPYVREP